MQLAHLILAHTDLDHISKKDSYSDTFSRLDRCDGQYAFSPYTGSKGFIGAGWRSIPLSASVQP